MPLSTEVIVRSEDEVEFPSRCIACGEPTADEIEWVGLRGNPVGLWGTIPWILRRTPRLVVPAHRPCGHRLARAILWRNLVLMVFVLGAIGMAIRLEWSWWPTFAFTAAVILAPIVRQVFRPVAFEFTHHGDYFKLDFRDRGYAREVCVLNDGGIEDEDDEDGEDKEPPSQAAPGDPGIN